MPMAGAPTPDDVRELAVALPEVEEETHFRLPSFTVHGKGFVVVEKGDDSVLLSVDRATAEDAAAEEPDVFEVVWRKPSIFVGVRVDLAGVGRERLGELVRLAWQHKAPQRLVKAHRS
jgi:hypothetical protein